MKTGITHHCATIVPSLVLCSILILFAGPVVVSGEEYPGQGKDQLVDALDAAFARVLDSGKWREIINSDPVAGPLIVNIGDCYPRITEGEPPDEVEIYPFPENPTGLLKEILDNKRIRMGTFDVVETPGTFHVFDTVNPALMRAIIDELGKGYDIPPYPDPGAIEIVPVLIWPPSSSVVFTMLNNGDFDITDFLGALGATAKVGGVEQRRRKLARFTCTVFGTPWYIHVRSDSNYQTFDDVVADATADICVGQLSSRLSADYFKKAQSITQKLTSDDLVECSEGVRDGTYDAYLHFDPEPYLPELKSIPMQIVSGIPIWVAGDTSTSESSTTTIEAASTTTTTAGACPSETIYGEHARQTELLRRFRDQVLSTSLAGQEIIRLYYQWSPVIVEVMMADGRFKKEVQEVIDGVLMLIDKDRRN